MVTSDNPKELFSLLNEQGEVIGKASRAECHNGSRLLHPVVHLHLFNSRVEKHLPFMIIAAFCLMDWQKKEFHG